MKEADSSHLRIGVHVFPGDPFWVQMREAVLRKLSLHDVTVVPLQIVNSERAFSLVDTESAAEEILACDLSVLISNDLTDPVVYQVLNSGLPIVYLSETHLQHALLTAPSGLYEVGRMAGELIVERLHGQGRVLCVGGLLDAGSDKGISRVAGFYDVLSKIPGISVVHCPTFWRYEDALPSIKMMLRGWDTAPDAIFGLSDSLALAARDAGQSLGLVNARTIIVGVNGDPLALAAIAEGRMTATVETSPVDIAAQVVDLALQSARGKIVNNYRFCKFEWVVAENALERSVKKLQEIADLPSQLVGGSLRQEQDRLLQLETSMAISRRVGAILDRAQLSHEIANLIRTNYGYDAVRLFLWDEAEQMFTPYGSSGIRPGAAQAVPLAQAGLLAQVVQRRAPVFIPDTRYSYRFSPEPEWAEMRSRVALPIHWGGSISGVLDLHSRQPMRHARQDLVGLQALADQLGVAMRNAELYAEALQARAAAEAGDRLKTRLLANVSHELRTPLNIIMGYSQSALGAPNPYQVELPPALRRDLEYILQSGEHLYHIINDLLDLSRAEIGALDLALEVVEPAGLLAQTFESFVNSLSPREELNWKLDIPERLPLIHADPIRLRQIVLNLLNNASKFTIAGQIALGAEVEPPYLHLWVQDTGPGIPIEQQERIFEPFVTSDYSHRRSEGVGLGLTITRRLVTLHGGDILLQSQPGQGSIFHVYFPLPDLSGEQTSIVSAAAWNGAEAGGAKRPVIVWISSEKQFPQSKPVLSEVKSFAAARHFPPFAASSSVSVETYSLAPGDRIEDLFEQAQPVALVWDMAAAAARQTTSREWSLIQRLRRQPACARLPFVLYAGAASSSSPEGGALTNVLLKPVPIRELREIFDGLRPSLSCRPVWIVDDDPEARLLYQSLASQVFLDLEILTAADGAQALGLLAQVKAPEQAPGLVLLDLMMPQVNGFQVLEALRASPLTQNAPVVVLSGKMLTFEDIQRLDYAQVTFQPKNILTTEETADILQQAFHGENPLSRSTSALARHALAYLQQNYQQTLSRAAVASAVGVTENYLTQIFRQEVGLTPWEYLSRLRIQKACELLRATTLSVTAIASQVAFDDPAYFSRVFRKQMGVSPQEYRRS